MVAVVNISIHAPREGGDASISGAAVAHRKFQSTPPARGATVADGLYGFDVDISIHAPREGGDAGGGVGVALRRHFNPRPPRGGRPQHRLLGHGCHQFQSTPPARGATCARWRLSEPEFISIHAPREGGDCPSCYAEFLDEYISIHAPREGGDSKDAQFYLWIFDK